MFVVIKRSRASHRAISLHPNFMDCLSEIFIFYTRENFRDVVLEVVPVTRSIYLEKLAVYSDSLSDAALLKTSAMFVLGLHQN